MQIKRGSLFLAKGPLRLTILWGRVCCRGVEITKEYGPLIVKAWETFDIEALEDTQIETTGIGAISRTKRNYPEDWFTCIDALPSNDVRSILIAGESDTGKSTLCTLIANRCISKGEKEVYIVDSDVGQSDIGPPTTVGLGCMKAGIIRLTETNLVDAFFAGDTSPAFCLEEVIQGTSAMAHKGKSHGGIIIIDTCGLVTGPLGQHLTGRILDVTAPDQVILLERQGELEYLASSGVESTRLTALPSTRKNAEARRAFRYSQFLSCLRDSTLHSYDLANVRVEGYLARRHGGKSPITPKSVMESHDLPLKDLMGMEGVIAGLHRGDRYIDLGLIDSVQFDHNTISILSNSNEGVNRIILGNLRMGYEGETRLHRFEGAQGDP